MIEKKLLEDSYLSADGNCYGKTKDGQIITIINNMNEIENNQYTREMADALYHISENIRTRTRVRLFEDFRYIYFSKKNEIDNLFDYKKQELSEEEIVSQLLHVLYVDRPMLEERTMVGTSKKGIENDPNRYTGHYILNNEKEYCIEKQYNNIEIIEMHTDKPFKCEKKMNWDVYQKSLELQKLSLEITSNPKTVLNPKKKNEILLNIEKYHETRKEIEEYLKNI